MPLIPVEKVKGLGRPAEPFTTSRFYLELDEKRQGHFLEISGLQAEVDVFSYEEGGCNDYVHRFPSRAKVSSNISLKRGVTYNDNLWSWFVDVLNGKISQKNVSVVLYDAAHNEKKRWNFLNAYPVKWVGPAFKANENAISFETLELAYERMQMKST
jgi:phage tail-like protein